MSKNKSKVAIQVELSYVSPGAFKEGSNSCDWNNPEEVEIVKAAHLNDEAKKILNSTLRANFKVEVNTKSRTILEINNEIQRLSDDNQVNEVIILSKELQNFILDATKSVFPDLKREHSQVIDSNWKDKLKNDKNSMLYYTNIYNWTNDSNLEVGILDILQKFVDKGLENFVELSLHYNCWAYYYNQQPYHLTSLQELINHRRTQIAL